MFHVLLDLTEKLLVLSFFWEFMELF